MYKDEIKQWQSEKNVVNSIFRIMENSLCWGFVEIQCLQTSQKWEKSVPSFYFLLACVLALLFRKCVLGHTVPQSALWNATQSSDTSPRLSVLPPWDPIPNMLKVQLSTSGNIQLETNRGLKVLCVSQTVKCVQLHWEVKIWKLRGLFSILCETLQYLLLP